MSAVFQPIKAIKQDWPLLLLMLLAVIAGGLLFPQLPEQVPSHWNLQGEVDGYVSRSTGAYGLPLGIIGIYLLSVFVPLIDPKKKNYEKFLPSYSFFRRALIVFLEGLYATSLLYALDYPVNVSVLVRLGVGVLFIIIGNLMGKLQHNYTFGIRTPWTLADAAVWRETHRKSARVWVLAGFLVMLSALFPEKAAFAMLLISLIGAASYSTVLSYYLYRQKNQA